MSGDRFPAVIKNDADSGILLVVIPDCPEGAKQPAPVIVRPGESSNKYVRSIDALAAYSIETGQPVKLQMLDMAGDRGESAHLWKYPDGSHATVKSTNGGPVLDMRIIEGEYYVPFKGKPSPSTHEVWGVDAKELQQIIDEQLKRDAEAGHSRFGPGRNLELFLKESFSAKDAAAIYARSGSKC